MENKAYYLDYAATAPMSARTFLAMQASFCEEFGNPSSVHEAGQRARAKVEEVRTFLAACIQALPNEIYFTSGGTESDNLAIRMGAMSRRNRGNHLITTKMEHPAVLETVRAMEQEGFEVSYIAVDESGRVILEDLLKNIRNDTVLISVMAANHEVGTLQPIAQIGQIAKERDILFHTDAVQAFGQIPIDVNHSGVDLLTASAHKIGGPKGTGLLYVRNRLSLMPMLHGGGQERGLRSGTENVPGIAGFGAAARERFIDNPKEFQNRMEEVEKIRDYLIDSLTKEISNCKLTGHPTLRLPGNVHVRFEGIETHQLVQNLSRSGIYVSAGSACHSHDPKPSSVLKAMGYSHREAYSGLRISFDAGLTKADAEEIILRIKEEVCHFG